MAACGAKSAKAPATILTSGEAELTETLGFDAQIVARVRKHGMALERQESFEGANFTPIPGPGLVLVTQPKLGISTLRSLRDELSGTTYQAWLNDNSFGFGPDKIVILKSRDPYAYLASIPINGTNYNIDHDQIVEKYRE